MITGTRKRTAMGGYTVFVNGVLLDPRPSQKLYNHSPNGFAWGYEGSGPAQLALAILLHYTNRDFALEYHQMFKASFIAKLPAIFTIRDRAVRRWIRERTTNNVIVGKE